MPAPTLMLTLLPMLSRLLQVQAALCAFNPALEATFVDVETAHLTMMVLRLAPEDEARASSHLLALGPVLAAAGLLQPVRVQLRGLSSFNNQVRGVRAILVLRVHGEDSLAAVCSTCALVEATAGVLVTMHESNHSYTATAGGHQWR